jgi:hypothetical protein
METQKNQHKLFFISLFSVLFLIFVLLIIVVLVGKKNGKKPESMQTIMPKTQVSPTPIIGNGQIILNTSRAPVAVNDLIPVTVIASSATKAITGYDVILKYDPAFIQVVSHTNKNDNFTIYKTDKTKDGMVIFTGSKNFNSKSITLENNELFDIQLKALKQGQTSIDVEYTPGSKADSNLVDTDNMDVLGRVEGISLTIE